LPRRLAGIASKGEASDEMTLVHIYNSLKIYGKFEAV
jgi:hypothetical protein